MLYRIHYDYINEPEALWRIFAAISRRALPVLVVNAVCAQGEVVITMKEDQYEQLMRDWQAIVGVQYVFSVAVVL